MLSVNVNFTQTTSIAAMTGFMFWLNWDLYTGRRSKILHGIAGSAFILIAGAIRWDALLLCLPFGIMRLLYRLLVYIIKQHRSDSAPNSIAGFCKSQILIPLIAIIATVFCSYGIHFVYGKLNPTWAEYVKANELECDIYDYSDRYPSWEDGKSQYESAGIKQSWYSMIFQSYTGDTNHFSANDMSKMLQFRTGTHKTLTDYIHLICRYRQVWITVFFLVLIMSVNSSICNVILPALGNFMAFLLCGLFFVHMGRFEWRVTSGITLSCVLLFIIMTSEFHLRKVAFRKVIRIITLCLTLSITILTATYTLQKKAFQFPSAEITDTKKAELLDYMNSNSNIVYFAENDFYSAYNIWTSRPV